MSWIVFASSALLAWCYSITAGTRYTRTIRFHVVVLLVATFGAVIFGELGIVAGRSVAAKPLFLAGWIILIVAWFRSGLLHDRSGSGVSPAQLVSTVDRRFQATREHTCAHTARFRARRSSAGVNAAALAVRPDHQARSIKLAPLEVKAPAVAGGGFLSDHRTHPGDADSHTE